MAKIYETQADYQRDQLDGKVKKLHEKSSVQDSLFWSMFGGAMLVEIFNNHKPDPSKWLRNLSMALNIGALVMIIKSWGTSSKIRETQRQRDALGPESIVLPPGVTPPGLSPLEVAPVMIAQSPVVTMDQQQEAVDPSCGCKFKRGGAPIEPKNFLEHVAKSEGPKEPMV